MNDRTPPSPPARSSATAANPTAARPRRRWLRWLVGLFLLLLLFIGFLPNIIALPAFRGRLIDALFAKFDAKVSLNDLSLGWFSPLVVTDLSIQPADNDRAAIFVHQLAGDLPLWQLIFGHRFGTFRVEKPEVYVKFDKDGSNIGRLLRGIGGSQFGRRAGTLDIVDGRLLMQGPNSPQPWKTDGMSLNVSFIPAADSPEGVAVLDGGQARFLKDCELTPEMANDIFKYIVPFMAEATRTSGRVSLELDSFHWPLGKPELVKLQGQLTLESVDVAPGPLFQSLGGLIELPMLGNSSIQIAKDDVVAFDMHDGRVNHENLMFALAMIQPEITIRSHGSVGLDETLDWFIDLQFQKNTALADNPLVGLLGQRGLTLHNTGTLGEWQWKPEGISSATFNTLMGIWKNWRDRGDEPASPNSLPGRQRSGNPPR
jgi:hypothetical protein